MIWLAQAHLDAVKDAAEAAYPNECCGLLVGRRDGDDRTVDQVVESRNLASDPSNSFEIDMRLRLTLQKQLRGKGREIIGHYHSHPDGPARPSERDREQAWEPDLTWLIISVTRAGAEDVLGYAYDDRRGAFDPVSVNGLSPELDDNLWGDD